MSGALSTNAWKISSTQLIITGHSPTREIIDLGVTEQELDRPQVTGAPVDQRGLGPAQRMGPEHAGIETDGANPVADKACILPGR